MIIKKKIIKKKKFYDERSWDEFRETGLLWFINSILHVFGWAIALEMEENTFIKAVPSRVRYRGFDGALNDECYKKVAKYMKEKGSEIYEEIDQ